MPWLFIVFRLRILIGLYRGVLLAAIRFYGHGVNIDLPVRVFWQNLHYLSG
jgi:hypothetical protein